MTKEDAQEQMRQAKIKRVFHHNEVMKIEGQAVGLTNKEWNSMEVKVKGSGTKGKGFANNKLWNHNNLESVSKMKFE
tara:strand:- start:364 stop:594 length:231 start_codon:yes stop_codon:yes gene_type:complete